MCSPLMNWTSCEEICSVMKAVEEGKSDIFACECKNGRHMSTTQLRNRDSSFLLERQVEKFGYKPDQELCQIINNVCTLISKAKLSG